MVEKLIGTSTSSFITSVTPQYPVCALSLPLANVGVILIFALIFSLFLFKKYVFPTYSPFLTASSNQPATFCKTISPGEKSDTLFLPIISSLEYPNICTAPSFIVNILPSISHVIVLFFMILIFYYF